MGARLGISRPCGGEGVECPFVSLLQSDVFPGLAAALSPVDLSRLALTCRAGNTATSPASVWRRSCARHYRFGQARRQRAEVQLQARRCREGEVGGEVALARAWRHIAAGLWWHTRRPDEDPVEEVLQWMRQHSAARVSVPVGFQGVRSRWQDMMRPAKATAVWQREYRVIASLLHSVNFAFPLLARIDKPGCTGAAEGEEPAPRPRRGLVDMLLSAAMVVHSKSHERDTAATARWAQSFRAGDDAGEQVQLAPNLQPLALRGGMQVFEHLVPSVTGIQILLEEAYAENFDPPGAAYFDGGQLVGKTKPIGATECAVILRYLGIRAMLFDMRSPSPGSQTHESLMELCRFWFLSEHSCRFPLYLQYGVSDNEAGSSLLVVGIYCSGVLGHCQSQACGGVAMATYSRDVHNGQFEARSAHEDEDENMSKLKVRGQCQGCARSKSGSECHVGVWENGTHEEWDTILVLNPDAAPTRPSKFPPPHMLRTPGALVPRGNESIHSLAASSLDWSMVQVVGCGMGDGPLDLTGAERAAWRDLSVGHYRIPDEPLSWDPYSLFGVPLHHSK